VQAGASLKGKAGILTGGTSGFGFEIVKSLVANGASVAVFSIDEVSDAALKEARAAGPGLCEFNKLDITGESSSEEMVERTAALFGRLDFAIANAGLAIRFEEPLLDMPQKRLKEALRAQFEMFPIAFASLAIAAARVMAPVYSGLAADGTGHRPDSGAIVVTLSEAAIAPLRDDLFAYAAAKRAGLSMMQSLAATLGPYNIRVNGIAPGFADTAGPRKFYERHPHIRSDIEKKNHLKPAFMHPSAVVPAVLYLLSDNYVTGECIMLDGGHNIDMGRYFQDGSRL
jgi:3-oxoacyl-[acyl-carrier protein] reductase